MCGSCHTQSVLISVKYRNWCRTMDFFETFDNIEIELNVKEFYNPDIFMG